MIPQEPKEGGTFVAHHMTFSKQRVIEMLDLMVETTGCRDLPWPKLIMSYSRIFYRFSEYKTYATYMTKKHPSEFNYHPLNNFGAGGLRFREANDIIGRIVENCPVMNGGIPYNQIKSFFDSMWRTFPGADKDIYPAYIQLDHVYGLEGLDLNLTEEAPIASIELPCSNNLSICA